MTVTNPNDPWSNCPPHALEAFRGYVNKGEKPSGFALALLENDLMEALLTANRLDYSNLQNYLVFLKTAIPSGARGSKAAVDAWVAKRGKPVQVVVPEPKTEAEEAPALTPKRPRGRPKIKTTKEQ